MKYTFVILLFVSFLVKSDAQEIAFITQPAASKVGIQDAFEVRYIIKNAKGIRNFSLPNIPDFKIMGQPTQSNNTSIMNGYRSTSIELTYVFKPTRLGKCVVPGGIASLEDGKELRSNNVVVEVIEGSVARRPQQRQRSQDPFAGLFDDPFEQDPWGDDIAAVMQKQQQQLLKQLQRQMRGMQGAPRNMPPSQPNMKPELIDKKDIGDNLFIKVNVDKKTATIGEQVTASYKMYTRVPMEVNLTKLPSLNGFWSQDFKIPQPPRPTREVVNGKEYQVFELKRTALFPTQAGELELDPAEAEGMARILKSNRVKQNRDPYEDDLFAQFFGSMLMSDPNYDNGYMTTYDYEDVPVKLKSSPVKINVTEPPLADRPSSFDGAIGHFSIESNIDKTELTTDDMATITLRVSGTGNLKLIGTPVIKFPNDLDVYDTKVFDTITNTNDIIAGYKTFSYSFTPTLPGTFSIPSSEFTYYDVQEKAYKKLTTPSYTIHVSPGKNNNSQALNKLPKDIHDIMSLPIELNKKTETKLPLKPLYWGGFGLPILAYLFLVAYKRKEDKLQSDTVLFKNRRANKIAMRRLVSAEKLLKQNTQGPFYEETSKAVWLYLSDKLNIPMANLSKDVAANRMLQFSLPQDLQVELFRITDECEMALYSPNTGALHMQQTYNDALKLIGKLEESLS